MLVQCSASVADGGPTLNQHRTHMPCLLDYHLRYFTILSGTLSSGISFLLLLTCMLCLIYYQQVISTCTRSIQ